MKKIFATVVMLGGLWAGTHSIQINSAAAQMGTLTTTIIPLTNQAPFTATLVPPPDLTTIQLSNVVMLLLTLQTNIEETLPVLDLVQSNAFVVSVTPANRPVGVATPLTNELPLTNSVSPILTPTGAASGTTGRRTSLAVRIGTNEFTIDAPTLQALFLLRGNLQQSLTVLQALNGTEPPPTNSGLVLPSASFFPPPVTNFSPGPLTNRLAVPPSVSPGTLSPF